MAGAQHFSELVIWQLADELRRATFPLTEREAFLRDYKLRAHAEDSINSTCRNIAEGFGCETHREFARFLRIARRSLNELQDAFQAALEKGYITPRDLDTPRRLLRRIFPAFGKFLAYLDRTPNQRNRPRRESEPPGNPDT